MSKLIRTEKKAELGAISALILDRLDEVGVSGSSLTIDGNKSVLYLVIEDSVKIRIEITDEGEIVNE